MIKRIFSTLTIWSILITTLYCWKATAGIYILTALACLTQFEFYQLLRKMGYYPIQWLGIALGFVLILGTWYAPLKYGCDTIEFPLFMLFVSMGLLSLTLLLSPCKPGVPNPLMPTLFGLVFIPFMLQFFVQIVLHYHLLEQTTQGLVLTLWLIATAKFTDIGGLIIGTHLGRHKMAPLISPGKTWEGAFGGIVVATGLGALFCIMAKEWLPENFTVFYAITIAIALGIVAIVSDLMQSVLKRQAQSKDSGYLIPGIGGVFDLTDSLIFVSPLGYYLSKLFIF